MKNKDYKPEGVISLKAEKRHGISDLKKAMLCNEILEARCLMCDEQHNLHVKVFGLDAIIPREQTAVGIAEGKVGDVAIITRVNKSVCFKVKEINENAVTLSRADAQREYLEYIFDNFSSGDIIDAKITHIEQFGAFCDIGCGVVSMIPIDCISVSRIGHPSCRFQVGQDIKVIIKNIDRENERISVTHKELLGTWEENAGKFCAGQTVTGIVRSVESYGIFIELTPNLAGLAEVSENVKAGDRVSVYIKNIIPEKMKVKLAIVEVCPKTQEPEPIEYIFKGDKINYWRYSPISCSKITETVFE